MESAEVWIEKIIEFAAVFGPKLIGAILIYIIGTWIIKKVVKLLRHGMSSQEYDKSLQKFFISLAKWALTVFLIITVIATLGVETTSFAAVIAAAGLAIGLALQGSLSNFAGGVLIMIFKPYKIDDLVEAQGILGSVKEIEIFTTKLITPQNKLAIIPNGAMANGNIINYTAEGKMRVDTTVGIDYGADIKKAKEVLLAMLKANPMVLADPAPSVNVEALADSSVNLAVRPFCKPEHYWDVYFTTIEGTKEALDNAGVEIPYPHEVQINK